MPPTAVPLLQSVQTTLASRTLIHARAPGACGSELVLEKLLDIRVLVFRRPPALLLLQQILEHLPLPHPLLLAPVGATPAPLGVRLVELLLDAAELVWGDVCLDPGLGVILHPLDRALGGEFHEVGP